MRRTFAFDVLVCPVCRGRMRLLAAVTDEDDAKKILAHLGKKRAREVRAPSRGPPQGALPFADATYPARERRPGGGVPGGRGIRQKRGRAVARRRDFGYVRGGGPIGSTTGRRLHYLSALGAGHTWATNA